MPGIVAAFKALTLDEMIRAYPDITAALVAAKEERRSQLEAEIRQLGFEPGEGKRHPRPPSSIATSATRPRRGRAAVLNQPSWRPRWPRAARLLMLIGSFSLPSTA